MLARGHPLVLVGDGDVGGLIGIHLREEMRLANPIVSIDGLELKEFDYIDIGAMLPNLRRGAGGDQVADLSRERRARQGVAARAAGGGRTGVGRKEAHAQRIAPSGVAQYASRLRPARAPHHEELNMPMPAALSRNLRAPSVIAGALLLATNVGAAEHTLMPSPQTVHIGHFLAQRSSRC